MARSAAAAASSAAALALLLFAAGVDSHGMMTIPAARDGTQVAGPNKGGDKGPCGKGVATLVAKGAVSATLAAGAETTVEWRM
eukprot:SAG22_NODE_6945_length_792_cov_1.405483_2_plen_83_part_00